MRYAFLLALPLLSALMVGCNPDRGQDAGTLNKALPRDEIVGCYRSDGIPLTVRVDANQITADGKPVYSSYDYGLGGRDSVPLLIVRPRMELQRDDSGTYNFKAWKQGLGSSFSYHVDRQNGVSIRIISSDAIEHQFVRVPCN